MCGWPEMGLPWTPSSLRAVASLRGGQRDECDGASVRQLGVTHQDVLQVRRPVRGAWGRGALPATPGARTRARPGCRRRGEDVLVTDPQGRGRGGLGLRRRRGAAAARGATPDCWPSTAGVCPHGPRSTGSSRPAAQLAKAPQRRPRRRYRRFERDRGQRVVAVRRVRVHAGRPDQGDGAAPER